MSRRWLAVLVPLAYSISRPRTALHDRSQSVATLPHSTLCAHPSLLTDKCCTAPWSREHAQRAPHSTAQHSTARHDTCSTDRCPAMCPTCRVELSLSRLAAGPWSTSSGGGGGRKWLGGRGWEVEAKIGVCVWGGGRDRKRGGRGGGQREGGRGKSETGGVEGRQTDTGWGGGEREGERGGETDRQTETMSDG